MLRRISTLAAGRRAKWVVLGLWLVLALALGPLQPKLQDATKNENSDFLPASADSTRVDRLLKERFREGREVDALVVYNREGGLTAADRARIQRDARELVSNGDLIRAAPPITPFGQPGGGGAQGNGPPLVSRDGTTAVMIVPAFAQTSDAIQHNVDRIRQLTPSSHAPAGQLRSYVTGPAGFTTDAIGAFKSIDTTLLLVTATLVLVLLLAIYRSPVIALVPLLVVGVAYTIVAAAVYGLVKSGAIEVNGQTTGILIVLMFGAGTDYCLLIVSRFREELRRTEDKHLAMAHAASRTGPAILSAGGTVFASMLVLTLADFKATQTMGPVLALGIAIMLLAGLTLLPALLSILGRRAFWPAVPTLGEEQRRASGWRRIGHLVHERPLPVLLACVVVLAVGSLGNLQHRGILDFGEGFQTSPDSKVGQDLIDTKLSAGQAAVTQVVADQTAAARVARALARSPDVAAVRAGPTSADGRLRLIDVTLASDPLSDAASNSIPRLRDVAGSAAGGELALVGGITAENHDTDVAFARDSRLIVPLVLVLIFLILVLLLRAVVAPLYLVATVVLSYAFALGASKLAFNHLFGQPDSDASLALFAFIFLVALGVDYNIFLISRIREESGALGVKEGVIAGLEHTGGVITGAGLILAGTFAALMSLPLTALFQLGFTVALGLLVDTFIVRTLMVPSIAFSLGEWNWWPSRRDAGSRARQESQIGSGAAPPLG